MKNLSRDFPNRITKWITLDALFSVVDPFYKSYGEEAYGNEFIIKHDKKKNRFAVYVPKNNQLRREYDKKLKADLGDLVTMVMPQKQEEVSILKTLSRYI